MSVNDPTNPSPGAEEEEYEWPPEPLDVWPYNQLPRIYRPPAPRPAAPAPAPPAASRAVPAPPQHPRDVLPPATVPYHPRAAEQAVTGDQIREARKRLGWTQAELARRVGLSRPFIALVEQGRRILAPQDLDKVREILGV